MATVLHLRCHHCGEPLRNGSSEYCPECNLALAYRAMPFLLGMILTGRLATDLATLYPHGLPPSDGLGPAYEDEAALIWE